MTRQKKFLLISAVFALAIIECAPILAGMAWLQMVATLEHAKREGVYPTAEDGMRARASRSWGDIEKIEIVRAGPNAFDGSQSHVWFVIAKVWAARRGDGKPVSPRGYGAAGSFFVRVQDGWVHVPEGSFPELVGALMELFDYEG